MNRQPSPGLPDLDAAWATLSPAEREDARARFLRYLELVVAIADEAGGGGAAGPALTPLTDDRTLSMSDGVEPRTALPDRTGLHYDTQEHRDTATWS